MRGHGRGILLSAKIGGEFSREVEECRGFFLGHVSNRRCHARLFPLPSKSELFHWPSANHSGAPPSKIACFAFSNGTSTCVTFLPTAAESFSATSAYVSASGPVITYGLPSWPVPVITATATAAMSRPVFADFLHVIERNPLRPIRDGLRVGPARGAQALFQIFEICLVDMNLERPNFITHVRS